MTESILPSTRDTILGLLFQGERAIMYCPHIIDEIADTCQMTPAAMKKYLAIMVYFGYISYKFRLVDNHTRLYILDKRNKQDNQH